MGRGSSDLRSLSQQQLDLQNANVTQQQQTVGADRALLLPKATELLNSTGYDQATKDAITGRAMESTDAAFDAGNQQMMNSAARRRNNAGLFSNMAANNQGRAQQKSDTARALPQMFADTAHQYQMQGLQALSSQYGIDTNLLAAISGLPNASLNNYGQGISNTKLSLGPFGQWG